MFYTMLQQQGEALHTLDGVSNLSFARYKCLTHWGGNPSRSEMESDKRKRLSGKRANIHPCLACQTERFSFTETMCCLSPLLAAHLRDRHCLRRSPRWKTPGHKRAGWPMGTICCFEDWNTLLRLRLFDSCQSSDGLQRGLLLLLHLGCKLIRTCSLNTHARTHTHVPALPVHNPKSCLD